ncbi:MAG: MotA/TolQ/ExbB proton channel family protein, partial [Deltaproteobacteria bacterium]|nr:MotA/TolQ/ExbB proton channel family protein [Deltaproteobacteria bacterium]
TETLVKVALLGAEWVLYVLVVLSAVSVALIVERALVLRRTRRNIQALEARFLGLGGRNGDSSGVERTKEYLLLEALGRAAGGGGADNQLMQSQVQGVVAAYRRHLDRFMAFLGTLGNNAPFIGLFGTVIGVIVAFDQLKVEMEGGAASVMGGIAEALVATAAGLAVAIPAVVAFNYFSKLAEGYVERFELLAWIRVRGRTDE